MSCGAGKPNFRLLDAYVGWAPLSLQQPPTKDETTRTHLVGFDDPNGIRLELVHPGAVDPATILAYLLPARLARGCNACQWYLVTPKPKSRLLERDRCHSDWSSPWSDPRMVPTFDEAIAVATWRRHIAVCDRGAGRVYIWSDDGERLIATIRVDEPGVIAFSPYGELLVVSVKDSRVLAFGLDGIPRKTLPAPLKLVPNRMAVDRGDRVWIVTGSEPESWQLWRASREATEFKPVDADELRRFFPSTGIVASSDEGFCLVETASDGQIIHSCFSCNGKPLDEDAVPHPQPPQVVKQGQLLTNALDSGIPRCRWHRVRIDADVPMGTGLSVSVATTEDPKLDEGNASRGTREPEWRTFVAGPPHFSDWTTAPASSLDFLVDQPPGRYLYFRMRFKSDGRATPVVRRVQIDFPRVTSLEHLPEVYREDPKAEDFTERFLSLFDATIADADRIIERYPALLDSSSVPDQVLPWLAGFFGIGLDPSWDSARRRRILQAAPNLYQRRGTVAGLLSAIEVVFGAKAGIEEQSTTSAWGAIARPRVRYGYGSECKAKPPVLQRSARLGMTRLFGTSRARLRLNHSALGSAPLRSYGNPDLDPFLSGAYRFRVLVPKWPGMTKQSKDRLTALIESQKPAHTVASVRVGGEGFLLGKWAALGVDTSFAHVAAPILGSQGNVRLNRMSVLWNGRDGRKTGAVLGHSFVLGKQICN